MVIDSIRNIDAYESLHKAFPKVFAFLKTLSKDTAAGPFVLDEGNVYGNVVETETRAVIGEAPFERHEKFFDIHYMLEGEEAFGYQDAAHLTVTRPYEEEGDYALLAGRGTSIVFPEGFFCITFPFDAHTPDGVLDTPSKVKRVVVKVRI